MLSSAQSLPGGGVAALTAEPAVATRDATTAPVPHTDTRIDALDGLRGILAFTVCISHFFGEVPHGVSGLMLGWIAVKMFFVLSGFLVARIVLDNLEAGNFFRVFYMRRVCRTLPAYLVTVAFVFVCAALFHDRAWMEADRVLPLWSYLTFTQPLVMIARNDFGSDWLLPTWTLTVEEQFYLVAPLICLLVPRRHLLLALFLGLALSLGFRALVYGGGVLPEKAALVTLPAACHSMFLGMIAALLLRSAHIAWERWDLALRLAPLVLLVAAIGLKAVSGATGGLFDLLGVPLVSVAGACYLAAIARNAPEADSLKGPVLKQLGRMSYSLYLMHMPVLGLMHGLLLGARPDIGTPVQLAVTVLCVPVALGVAWASAKWIEEPMIAYGKTWKWRRG